MVKYLKYFLNGLNGFSEFFKASALIWVTLVVVGLLLAFPAQMHEYYRVAAVEFGVNGRSSLAISFYVFACIIALIGFISVVALNITGKRSSGEVTRASLIGEHLAASISVVLPLLGLLVGLVLATPDVQSSNNRSQAIELIYKASNQATLDVTGRPAYDHTYKDLLDRFSITAWLKYMAGIAAGLGIALLLIINIWPVRGLARRAASLLAKRSLIAVIVFGVAYLSASYFMYRNLAQARLLLGTFGFLTLGLGLFCGLMASLASLSRQVQFPFCFVFLAWPIMVALFGWSNNDQILDWKSPQDAPTQGGSEDSISAYLTPRLSALTNLDGAKASQRPTPIYVVAAPGGGIYASYFVSTVLTHATEAVPKFRQHLFAVSAVSGGALGTTLYSALYQDNEACRGYIGVDKASRTHRLNEELSRQFLMRQFHVADLLAPVTGSLLFLELDASLYPHADSGIESCPYSRRGRWRSLEDCEIRSKRRA